VGQGYGDGQLNWICTMCNTTIDHEALRLSKLRIDSQNLVNNDNPLPKTITDVQSGLVDKLNADRDQLFPN